MKTDEEGNPLPDPFIVSILKKKMDELVAQNPIGELLFGPGISLTEIREVKHYSQGLNLRVDTRQYQGQQYLVMYEKFSYKDMVPVLKERKAYGKFVLVEKSELPDHASIEKDLEIAKPASTDSKQKPTETTVKVELNEENKNKE